MISELSNRLTHVRWIAGGTGAGKTTITRILAERHGLAVYLGDVAERTWIPRFTPEGQPHAWATLRLTKEQRAGLSGRERFESMASRHGETIEFVVEDVLAMPADRPILADWFGNAPRDLAPLLTWPEQAVFLVPTPEFRRQALTTRFADPDRARATWGSGDHERALANRLARDELWDAELRHQADEMGLPVIVVDGSRSAEALADDLADRFRLGLSASRR